MNIRAAVIDVETTDKGDNREVIELAWALFESAAPSADSVIARFFGRYKPEGQISFGAMATHNIIPADLEGCHKSSEARSHMADVEYVVGHNVDFDAESLGLDCKRICTLAMARALLPSLDSHTQTALIYFFGSLRGNLGRARERVKDAHNAKADVENCIVVLLSLLSIARGQGHELNSWDSIYAFSEACRVPEFYPYGKYKGHHMATVPDSHRKWYAGTENPDRYILAAFEKYPVEV